MMKKTLATMAIGIALVGGIATPANAASEKQQKEAITDVANQILVEYAEGDLKDDMTFAEAKKVIGELEVPAGTNMNMSMVYTPELPSVFSICGWDKSGTITKASAYKSPNASFSPILINCDFDNINTLNVVEDENWTATPRPATDLLGFDKMEGLVSTNNAPVPAPAETNVVEEEEAEPANIPWGWIGFVFAAIVALFAFIGLGVFATKMFRKGKKSRIHQQENKHRWEAFLGQHDAVQSEWASYELDIVKILDLPLLADMRESVTVAFHAALRKANNLRPKNADSAALREANDSPYASAVETLVNTFEVAKTEAKRLRWSKFSEAEQKRLKRAQSLLNLAINSGASEAERQGAYKRMLDELEGLIVVPKNTQIALEQKVNLSITDGRESLVKN